MDQCEDKEEGVPPANTTLCGEHESQTKAQRLTEVHKQIMMEEEEDRAECAGSSWSSVMSDLSKQLNLHSNAPGPTRSDMVMCTDDMDGNKIYPVTEFSISNRIALLINILHFYDVKSNRYGAEYDAQAMLNLLHQLGYEVLYYQDLTAQEIDEALNHFSQHRKLLNTDSVFVVLMSHGNLGTISGSDRKSFEIDKIYERLNTKNCPALMNKPKVIIIQACRGENEGVFTVDGSRQPTGTENKDPPSTNVAKVGVVHVEKDFLGFHSSTPHTYSYRNPGYGSSFFHYICDAILTGCCQDDIEELFKKVMQQFEDFPSVHKQMPTKERDTLTKHFYLFPGIKHQFPGEKHLPTRLKALRLEPAGGRWLRPFLRKYSCQLTIDTNTVHTNVKLSENNRKMTYGKEVQSYPDHPDRFDFYPQLLCRNGLTGLCYWEIECRGHIFISVSYRRVRRKGDSKDCRFGCNDQSWSLSCSKDGPRSVWYDGKRTPILSSSSVSNRVAVFVDCPAGTLSFYKVSSDTLIHLHTFNTTFTQTLYPAFTLWPDTPVSSVYLC